MSQRVVVGSKVNALSGSRSESESEEGAEFPAADPKPRELFMVRVQPS